MSIENVIPDWATQHVDADNCSVLATDDGRYAIVDWNLQTSVAVADTTKECYRFIHDELNNGRICVECGINRMYDGGGYFCPLCELGENWE